MVDTDRDQPAVDPQELPCTPSALLAQFPCIQCLSESEMLMLFMLLLADLVGYDITHGPNQIFEDSKCFTCLSDKQLIQAGTAVLANLEFAVGHEGNFSEIAGCVHCANPKQVKAAIVFLWCSLFSGIGL